MRGYKNEKSDYDGMKKSVSCTATQIERKPKQTKKERRQKGNKEQEDNSPLNEVSQRLKNGSRTVALICPQAHMIRLISAPMTILGVQLSSDSLLDSILGPFLGIETRHGMGMGKGSPVKGNPVHSATMGRHTGKLWE